MTQETAASDQIWNNTVPAEKDSKESTGKWYPKFIFGQLYLNLNIVKLLTGKGVISFHRKRMKLTNLKIWFSDMTILFCRKLAGTQIG